MTELPLTLWRRKWQDINFNLFKALAVVNQIAGQAESDCDIIVLLVWPQRPQQRRQAAADSNTENLKSFKNFKPKLDLRDVRLPPRCTEVLISP